MDEQVASWILEFVLRQDKPDWFVNQLIHALPLSSPLAPRLKKTILLRRIAAEISRGSISEQTLFSLELIDEIDRDGGVDPSDQIKAAYCAVAVSCTVNSLHKGEDDFLDAVYRIWLRRVADLERSEEAAAGLVSDELKAWKEKMGHALTSARVREEILKGEAERNALESARVYLKKAFEEMGPPFLERAAEAVLEKGLILEVQPSNPPEKFTVGERSPGRERVSTSLDRGQDASNYGECNTSNPPEVGTVADRSLGGERSSRSIVDKGNVSDASNKGGPATDKFDCLTTPEVGRVKEALQSSRAALQTVVEDPLPDAVITATGVLADRLQGATNLKEHGRTDGQNNDAIPSCSRGLEGNRSGSDVGAPACSTEKVAKVTNTEGNTLGRGQNKGPDIRPHRSLMDKNPTARTYEWEDSIESAWENLPSPSGSPSSKPCLPTPKRRTASPLKTYEEKNFVRRRKMKKWSTLEEDTLREAVKKHGKGNWKRILSCYSEVFEERTEVDLKDKWRNMTRSFPSYRYF